MFNERNTLANHLEHLFRFLFPQRQLIGNHLLSLAFLDIDPMPRLVLKVRSLDYVLGKGIAVLLGKASHDSQFPLGEQRFINRCQWPYSQH